MLGYLWWARHWARCVPSLHCSILQHGNTCSSIPPPPPPHTHILQTTAVTKYNGLHAPEEPHHAMSGVRGDKRRGHKWWPVCLLFLSVLTVQPFFFPFRLLVTERFNSQRKAAWKKRKTDTGKMRGDYWQRVSDNTVKSLLSIPWKIQLHRQIWMFLSWAFTH